MKLKKLNNKKVYIKSLQIPANAPVMKSAEIS